jgi:hypothetical protein
MSNASDLLSIEKVVVPTPIPDPGYPVGPYILHGEVLYKLAHLHKNALTDPKYDWETCVEKIPMYCGATREASSNWSVIQFEKPESNRQWAEYRKETDTLLTQLFWIMRYAYRDSEDLLAQLSLFKVAGSNPEVIQALNDIAVNGRKNLELLLATPKFEESMLDRAAELSDLMGDLYATVIVDASKDNELKLNRNKAFYLLDKALHDLVAYAKMVFANKPEIAKQFTIEPSYREGIRRASKQSKEKTTESVLN